MADFDVIVASGATVQAWVDPPRLAPAAPSRLNARVGYLMKRWVGQRGTPVVLQAVVDGVVAPLDSALGGRLFTAWAVEVPDNAVPFSGIAGGASQSSVQTFWPTAEGHYTIGVRRPDGGLVHVHLDIA